MKRYCLLSFLILLVLVFSACSQEEPKKQPYEPANIGRVFYWKDTGGDFFLAYLPKLRTVCLVYSEWRSAGLHCWSLDKAPSGLKRFVFEHYRLPQLEKTLEATKKESPRNSNQEVHLDLENT